MSNCRHCGAEEQTDGVYSWCVQADCASNWEDVACAECGDDLPPGHDPRDLCPICAITQEALRSVAALRLTDDGERR